MLRASYISIIKMFQKPLVNLYFPLCLRTERRYIKEKYGFSANGDIKGTYIGKKDTGAKITYPPSIKSGRKLHPNKRLVTKRKE
jgi:hypothetical protein